MGEDGGVTSRRLLRWFTMEADYAIAAVWEMGLRSTSGLSEMAAQCPRREQYNTWKEQGSIGED